MVLTFFILWSILKLSLKEEIEMSNLVLSASLVSIAASDIILISGFYSYADISYLTPFVHSVNAFFLVWGSLRIFNPVYMLQNFHFVSL